MAVSISNRFEALLSDSENEGPRGNKAQLASKNTAKQQARPAVQQTIPGFQAATDSLSSSFRPVLPGNRQRNDRPRGPRREGPPAVHEASAPADGSDHSGDGFGEKPRLNRPFNPQRFARGGARGSGRGRGGAMADGARPRRREFDRHSGDPKQPGPRKDGAGAYNWGGKDVKSDAIKAGIEEAASPAVLASDDELKNRGPPGESAEMAAAVSGEQHEGEDAEFAEKRRLDEEAEERRIDLEEYMRQLQAKRANLPTKHSEVSRNIDATELEAEGYERLERAEGGDEQRPNGKEGRLLHVDDDEDRKPKTYNFFDLAQQAGNIPRLYQGGGRPNRRGRGGERGGDRGGRGGGRQMMKDDSEGAAAMETLVRKRAEKVKLNLTDNQAFPALG